VSHNLASFLQNNTALEFCIDLPLTVFEIHIWYLYKITASYIDTQLQYCFVKLLTNSNFKVY